MKKRLMLLLALFAIPPAFAMGESVLGWDVPMGTEAGVVQRLDLANGKITINDRKMDLAPQAISSLSEAERRFGSLLGKVVVFRVDDDGVHAVIRLIVVRDAGQQNRPQEMRR